MFTLKPDADEADFLAAIAALESIPGVEAFELMREVSPKNGYEHALTMEFADQAAYTAYNEHPEHAGVRREPLGRRGGGVPGDRHRRAMKLDHVIYGTSDLDAAQALVEHELGLEVHPGGHHVGQGTHNRIVPLGNAYLELLAIDDPEEAAASPIGRSSRRRSPAVTG